ncbi:MAG: hypothetical protein EAY75_18175 [Bacteroidetes bacterium]|nr:MAG: hypothetical protein EAY75_18175 [Bacteroidota bacterium]
MLIKLVATAICFAFLIISGLLFNKLIDRKNEAEPSIFGLIVKGSLLLTCYLQVVSFFSPLHFGALLPLCAASLFFSTNRRHLFLLLLSFRRAFKTFHWLTTLASFAIFLVALSVPTINSDSARYHIPAAEFFHDYPLITGLANINEQVAINSVVFLLNAPFVRLFGPEQGIYPVNTVWVLCFTWWLLKSGKLRDLYCGPVFTTLLLFFCYRTWLANVNSPSNDPISGILILYVLIISYHAISFKTKPSGKQWYFLGLVTVWAAMVKLNTAPLLGIVAISLLWLPLANRLPALLKLTVAVVPMFGVWMARTYIMSGYLIFPFLKAPWPEPNYTVPEEITRFELFFLRMGPKYFDSDPIPFQITPLSEWFQPWLFAQFSTNFNWGIISLIFALVSMIAVPFLIAHGGKKRLYVPWAVSVAATVSWLVTSPDYRFAFAWLIGCWLPLIMASKKVVSLWRFREEKVATTLHFFLFVYFSCSLMTKVFDQFTIKWFLVSPKSILHVYNCKTTDTLSVVFYNTRISEVKHNTNCFQNTPWLWRYARNGLKARGTKISDGFCYDNDVKFLPGTFPPSIFNENRQQFLEPSSK